MDPATLTAVGALLASVAQGLNTWRKTRVESQQRASETEAAHNQKLDEVLDARVLREIQRMDAEITELRSEVQMSRQRILLLESHILKHNIPLPEGPQ